MRGVAIETPLLPSPRLSDATGSRIFVKAENTQIGGSFKLRGAYTKMSQLPESDRQRGVIAASMGNHAQGVALSAQMLGIKATIVMPEHAPLMKVNATQRYGGEVVLTGTTFDDADARAREIEQERGLTRIHAFNDPAVIAGQGVIGLEILDALPEVDVVIVPIGGGGLISGIATAIHALRPETRIIGVQASAFASIEPSLQHGAPVTIEPAATIADGIAVKRPGELTLPIIARHVEQVVTVSEQQIAHAILFALQNQGLVLEGAAATGIAALLSGSVPIEPHEQVCIVLSGANIDANLLARVIDQTLTEEGRYLVIRTALPDRPGNLAGLAEKVASAGANVIDIHHRRSVWGVPLSSTGLELILEVRDTAHGQRVVDQLELSGYKVSRVLPNEYSH